MSTLSTGLSDQTTGAYSASAILRELAQLLMHAASNHPSPDTLERSARELCRGDTAVRVDLAWERDPVTSNLQYDALAYSQSGMFERARTRPNR